MKRAPVRGGGQKRVPTEEKDEHRQPVAAFGGIEREQALVVSGDVENRSEIDLAELLRDRAGTLVVEPPPRAVGEDAPAESSGCEVIDATEVPEHLRGGSGLGVQVGAPVERKHPGLGLDDGEPQLVALPFLPEIVGAVLRRLVGEQQAVRYVIEAPRGEVLLAQARRPSEAGQDRPDQIVLGLALVRRLRGRKPVEDLSQRLLDAVERGVREELPLVEFSDGGPEKVGREQSAVEGVHGSRRSVRQLSP